MFWLFDEWYWCVLDGVCVSWVEFVIDYVGDVWVVSGIVVFGIRIIGS